MAAMPPLHGSVLQQERWPAMMQDRVDYGRGVLCVSVVIGHILIENRRGNVERARIGVAAAPGTEFL
jgi:hypothetical protein